MIRTGAQAPTSHHRPHGAATAVALALALSMAGAIGPASASTPISSGSTPNFIGSVATAKACPEKAISPHARCGQIVVPLNRDKPGAATISVAYLLLPRRDRSRPSLGTLVPNPGGPGFSTIDQAARYAETLAPLLGRRDLLLVDPRGTGRSSRLRCKAIDSAASVQAKTSELIAACGKELGVRANSYGSAAVADDIEAIRAKLGLDQLDLWGESYGTVLMQVYASRHPARVRSIMLSGAYPADFDPWGRDRLRAARRAIALVCERSGDCSGPAVLKDIERLAAQLRRHPLTFSINVAGTRQQAVVDEAALSQLVYTQGKADLFGSLPAAVHSALRGDPAALYQLVARAELESLALLHHPSGSMAAYAANSCHDNPRVFSYADSPAVRRSDYQAALAALSRAEVWPFTAAGWAGAGFEGADACIGWPVDSSGRDDTGPALGGMPDVPVLVLSGDLDANTPTEAGRLAAAKFRRATVVEVPDAGHTPGDYAACAAAISIRFVATLKAGLGSCTATRIPVSPALARHAVALPPVQARTGRRVRTALAVVTATLEDLRRQSDLVGFFGEADALRSGRYRLVTEGGADVRLRAVKVVSDARVQGRVTLDDEKVAGSLSLAGRGVPKGKLKVRLSVDGTGRASGTLDGHRIDVRFRVS